jgi:hypothetical protein
MPLFLHLFSRFELGPALQQASALPTNPATPDISDHRMKIDLFKEPHMAEEL